MLYSKNSFSIGWQLRQVGGFQRLPIPANSKSSRTSTFHHFHHLFHNNKRMQTDDTKNDDDDSSISSELKSQIAKEMLVLSLSLSERASQEHTTYVKDNKTERKARCPRNPKSRMPRRRRKRTTLLLLEEVSWTTRCLSC